MKYFKLSALLIIAALSVAAVASAALNGISFDRNVSGGKVLVDTDSNVAVQFMNTSKYTDLVKTDSDGKVSLNLSQAIGNNVNTGFNTDAIFTIGSASTGVIKIKNNSDVPVGISLTSDPNNNALSINPVNGSNSTIGSGATSDFYFIINTNGQDAQKILNAVLHVEAK